MKRPSLVNPSRLALVLLFIHVSPVAGQADVEETLLDLNLRLFQSLILDQDPGFLLSLSDETYVEVAPGGVVESRDQIIDDLWAFATVDSISVENERVIRSGGTAIVLNRLAIHGPIQGPIGEIGPITVMTVFGRDDDGAWAVVSRAYSICDPGAIELGLC